MTKTPHVFKHDTRIQCGVSVFTCLSGSRVWVGQDDPVYRKRIVEFNDRDVDWFSYEWIEDHLEEDRGETQ